MRHVASTARDLSSNLLRVIRGAGRPAQLVEQAQEFINALVEYRKLVGHLPSGDELAAALYLQPPPTLSDYDRYAQTEAMDSIVRGSLQIAAAELLGQRTQKAAGEHEVSAGVRFLQDARKALRDRLSNEASRPEGRRRSSASQKPRSRKR
jgi:hypothetical protein